MGTTSEKLTYLNGTKTLLKDVINYSGAGITSETTFRNYAAKLYDGYVDILKNKYVLLDNMPKGQVEGISAVINNAEDLPVYQFKFTKESTQHTTTGKNKFDKDNVSWYRNNGTGWGGHSNTSNNRIKTDEFAIEGNKSYTVSGYPSSVSFIGVRTYNSSQEYFSGATKNGDVITLNQDVAYIHLLFGGSDFTDDTNTLMKNASIQIEEGSIATSYEEYTGGQPSPNPDYPQEVNVVEGYRNLFDSNIEIGGINSQTGEPNSPLNPKKRTTNYISVEEKNYTLSSSSINIQAYCYCYDINKTYLGYLETNWTTLPFNFTTLSNTKFIKFVFRNPNNTEIGELSNLQLTEGNQELPYVPYGSNYILYKQVGKNLFDKDNANIYNGYISSSGSHLLNDSANSKTLYISIKPNTTYTMKKILSNYFRLGYTTNLPSNLVPVMGFKQTTTLTSQSITTGADAKYLVCNYWTNNDTLTEQEILDSIQIEEGSAATEYETYKESIIPIPLNNNIIAGKGNYKDELKVDKTGHVFINKKTGKKVFDGSDSISTATSVDNYYSAYITISDMELTNTYLDTNPGIMSNNFIAKPFSNIYNATTEGIARYNGSSNANTRLYLSILKSRLTYITTWSAALGNYLQTQYNNGNPVIVYYPLGTPQLIDLQTTVDINLFKGVNNVSNSEDGLMNVEYVKEYEEGE